MSTLQLAEAILAAAKCHEESYDFSAAGAATASAMMGPASIIDYSKFYQNARNTPPAVAKAEPQATTLTLRCGMDSAWRKPHCLTL